jgi:lipopolysaccharide biosynthesis glycosyltransferase
MQNRFPRILKDTIPVVASSDDNYAAPLSVMFVSLLENTSSPELIHFFVIDGGISELKKSLLKADAKTYGSQVTFLNVNNEAYASFPTKAHISAPAYYRISIPELFDASVEKAIYLDCDLIIKQDIQTLWGFELEEYPVAAIENISSSTYKASGLKQCDYFNSGVMLINLKAWRERGISEKVREFKKNHPELICTNDQCALNGVFKGQWKRLPLSWNMQSGLYRHSPQVDRLLKSETDEALWEPAIIHYIGWSKPWINPCYHPLEGEFRRYKDKGEYATVNIIDKNSLSIKNRSRFSLLKKRVRQRLWQYRYLKKGYNLY